jgi:hypothetical protein
VATVAPSEREHELDRFGAVGRRPAFARLYAPVMAVTMR